MILVNQASHLRQKYLLSIAVHDGMSFW
jgi:hypothetical protein